jgi:hypothetical protein
MKKFTINERVKAAIKKDEGGASIVKKCKNKTGFKGVRYHARDNLYEAVISVKKIKIYLGGYKTVEEAGKAYLEAKRLFKDII